MDMHRNVLHCCENAMAVQRQRMVLDHANRSVGSSRAVDPLRAMDEQVDSGSGNSSYSGAGSRHNLRLHCVGSENDDSRLGSSRTRPILTA